MNKDKSAKKKEPRKRSTPQTAPQPVTKDTTPHVAPTMTEQQAFEALARATTTEEKLVVIRAYGGVPVRASEKWREYLPLPAI